jgi:hypothetical protein
MLQLTEPRGTLLSYAAPYWAMLHPQSCAAPYWAKVLSYTTPPYELAHPNWATTNPTELRSIQLSYAPMFSTELRSTMWPALQPIWATFSTHSFVQFCQMPQCRTIRYRKKCTQVRYRNATVLDWDDGPEYRCRRHRPRCRCSAMQGSLVRQYYWCRVHQWANILAYRCRPHPPIGNADQTQCAKNISIMCLCFFRVRSAMRMVYRCAISIGGL